MSDYKFTILQSVYKNDRFEYLRECFESILKSSLKAEKIVLVKDGTISAELESVIEEYSEKLPLKVVGYLENKGLAYALNYGMKYVETEYIARMDSDDVIYPDRFKKQIEYLKNNSDIVLLSGYIDEFRNKTDEIVSTRKVPLNHEEISKYLKKRNAFNHMAVMFKKEVVEKCGGYQIVPYFEDYDLWVRIIQNGYKTANIPEKLVLARVGNDMIGRRHGFAYAKHEVFFLKRQLSRGYISKWEFIKLFLFRIPVRLIPKSLLEYVYKLLRR